METTSLSPFARRFRELPVLGALASVVAAITALAGWQWNVASLKSVVPGLVAMNPGTAVTFLLAGLSLIALRYAYRDRPLRTVGYGLAGVVTLVGLSKVMDVLGVTQLGFDQLLFPEKLGGAGGLPPNRMAPNTALSFTLVGTALLTLRWRVGRAFHPSQSIALLAVGTSLLAILGYALDVQQLYGLAKFIPMALNTALTFWALSLSILFAYPERGITRVFVAGGAGGTMARRVMPFALLVPALLAWGRLQAQRAGWFEVEHGISAMVFACIVLLTAVLWFTATRLNRAEMDRNEALEQLRQAHDGLEQRVGQRTLELEEANRQLLGQMEERKRTEEALRDSEERYRLLFFGNPHPMWVFDRKTLRFLEVNEAAVKLYGYDRGEFMAMTIKDIRPAEEVPEMLRQVAIFPANPDVPREWRHKRKDGSLMDMEVSAHALSFAGQEAIIVLAHDVTGRKHLETQLRQSQKMEAVGRLAGGVAHDFNNLLTAILGYSQFMRARLEPGDKMSGDLAQVERAALKAASLTRQLLAFSRQQVLQPKVLDLNAVIVDMDKMLRRLIGEDIDLLTFPAPDLGHVKADPGQIEQVVMNLAVNARDAMPEGGKLTIETANVVLDGSTPFGTETLRPGPYTMLAVSDNGTGMSSETKARIFEPFFTTKEIGKGTGLGLSTVHGIVKQSGGHIEVYSEPDRGTTFKVYLPRVDAPLESVASGHDSSRRFSGSETILVVEDDEMVRNVVTKTLRQSGYTVIEAMNRTEALVTCASYRDRGLSLDLMLSDVVMPGMGIAELMEQIGVLQPEMKILYMSGYADRAIAHQGMIDSTAAFLQKPFTIEAVLLKIREVLEGPQASAA